MPVKDQDIFNQIDSLQDHYHNNIYNRYIRKAFMHMSLPRSEWDALERLTEKSDFYRIQGYPYKELYEMILAAATFVHHAREEVLPNIKNLLAGGSDTVFTRSDKSGGSDRILRDMAINNFPANLGVFSDMVHELYVKVAALDKREHSGGKPIYERLPELKEMGQLLS